MSAGETAQMASGERETAAPAGTGELGLFACIALVVGNMIGSGIFLLPASLAPYGAISLVGWCFTSLGAIVLALVFGRLARLTSRPGGPYAYTRDGFGDFAGFLIAWGYWIALWSGNAAVAVAFVGYVGFLVPAVAENNLYGLGVALTAIWFLTMINIRGIEGAGVVQMLTTILKVLPLLAVCLLGWLWINPDHFTPANTSGLPAHAAVSATAALTLWAYLGLESATVPAGNVHRPEVTIPRATIIGVLFAAAIYIAVTTVAIGVLPKDQLAGSSAPLADVASVMWGPVGGTLIAAGAIVSTFGTLNGFTLLSGQVPYGAALDKVFPEEFASVSDRGTPANALVISNLLASGLVIMNFSKGLVEAFTFIILLATMASLVPYAFCAVAEILIRLKGKRPAERGRLAGAAGLGLLGFLYSIWAVYGSGEDVVFFGFLLLLAGVPIHVLIRWRQAQRRLPDPVETA